MSGQKSDGRIPINNRSATISEYEEYNRKKQNDDDDQQHGRTVSNPGIYKCSL